MTLAITTTTTYATTGKGAGQEATRQAEERAAAEPDPFKKMRLLKEVAKKKKGEQGKRDGGELKLLFCLSIHVYISAA